MRSAWLPRSVLVRAAIRSGAGAVGFLLRFGVGSDAIVVALHAAAAIAGGTALQRLALVRSVRGGTAAWRCALEAGLACVALNVVAAGNTVWWLGAPGLDPQERALAARLHGVDAPRRLPDEALVWLAVWSVAGGLWAGPALAASTPTSFGMAVAVGAAIPLAVACALAGFVVFACLCLLDRVAGRVQPGARERVSAPEGAPPTPSGDAPAG